MEYQVPQFIEAEDKIIGPLTLKQFIYLAGGAGLCVICIAYLPLILAIILCLPIVALSVALAFYKMNGKSFIQVLEAGFTYYVGPKFFLWKREEPKAVPKPVETPESLSLSESPHAPRLTRGKLSDLAWSLDVPRDDDETKKS